MKGSCACGAVRFSLGRPPKMMGTCHCSRCRKVGATPFVLVAREDFRWVGGQDELTTFEPEPPYTYRRSFCRRCGTAIGEPLSNEATIAINAHCLDDDPGVRNRFHEFVDDKPAWLSIGDDAQRFAGHPRS